MKIEKLTENKIRIIINPEDLEKNHLDMQSIMTKTVETHNLFLQMLLKAEKEVGFKTEGCKLLIESFLSPDGIYIFIITKYSEDMLDINVPNSSVRKKLTVKRKNITPQSTKAIYQFLNFDEFCNFCIHINNFKELNIQKVSKNNSLYLYNNTYYLIISKINTQYPYLHTFYSTISEFAKICNYSENFANKLLEHAKPIIKKNAILVGMQYFVK